MPRVPKAAGRLVPRAASAWQPLSPWLGMLLRGLRPRARLPLPAARPEPTRLTALWQWAQWLQQWLLRLWTQSMHVAVALQTRALEAASPTMRGCKDLTALHLLDQYPGCSPMHWNSCAPAGRNPLLLHKFLRQQAHLKMLAAPGRETESARLYTAPFVAAAEPCRFLSRASAVACQHFQPDALSCRHHPLDAKPANGKLLET